MLKKFKRGALLYAVMALVLLAGCSEKGPSEAPPPDPQSPPAQSQDDAGPTPDADTVVYHNTEYGFDVSLPEGWKDYAIVASQWEGKPLSQDAGEQAAASGPIVSIRHPQWTAEKPRQDIPVMVFTLEQWDSLQQEEFALGAAPMGPTELGRNNQYVFALPARYNYSFLEGYEEVEQILQGSPLHATQLSP